MLMFGDHLVAVGFVMCFSPYELEIGMVILHLILRVGYEIRRHKFDTPTKNIKTSMIVFILVLRILNMTLLICAMVGLSRTEYDEDESQCRDASYRWDLWFFYFILLYTYIFIYINLASCFVAAPSFGNKK